jgi:hypothetical protein
MFNIHVNPEVGGFSHRFGKRIATPPKQLQITDRIAGVSGDEPPSEILLITIEAFPPCCYPVWHAAMDLPETLDTP